MKKLFLSLLILSAAMSLNEAIAANVPADANIGGGVINNHDMTMLREKQRLHDEKLDYENFKKNYDFDERVINTNDIFENNFSDRIYNSETSQKLKERREQLQQSKKTKFSFKKKKKEAVN